jgi:predicted DNA-binding transcriptional regulator AlpA
LKKKRDQCWAVMKRSHPPKTAVLADTNERLVGTREILEGLLPVHRSTLNEMIAEKRFPAPIALTKSKLLWRWSTLLKWLEECEKHPVKRRTFRNLNLQRKTKRSAAASRT